MMRNVNTRFPNRGMLASLLWPSLWILPSLIHLTLSSTFAGVMWLEAPAWSSAPHFEGHHGLSVSLGIAIVSACAAVIGASPNLPCVAPATATALAPATPAAFRKFRRSVDADPASSIGSLPSVMCSSQEFALLADE